MGIMEGRWGYFGIFALIGKWCPKIFCIDWSVKADDRMCFGCLFVGGEGEEAG